MKALVFDNVTAPETEFSSDFMKAMLTRMAMSFFKYGPVATAFPTKVDALATLRKFLDLYERDGNTEHLVDAANYAMIEFMHPRHPQAHFRATESKESPGRKWHGDIDFSARSHRVERLDED